MKRSIRVQGETFVFTFDKNNDMYECRGRVCYDEEHDEVPEEKLWKAALELESDLRQEIGGDWNREHSEKGWVEVALR